MHDNGKSHRFKCRLSARGFLQKHGVDYSATFSPVVQAASIKLLLTIPAENLRQTDVSTTFLYGNLPKTERVYYIHCPSGIEHEPGQVMVLRTQAGQ